ncbi:MAG: hypothetical protein WBW94_12535 [Anaerolineales bacterium]
MQFVFDLPNNHPIYRSAGRVFNMITDRRGDDYGEKAVILVLVVLAGVAAFSLFGNKIVALIDQASAGI